MASTANLTDLGYGFIDAAYNAFHPDQEDAMSASIQKFIKIIKNSEGMMDLVREKAQTKNISVDSMIVLDATYLARKEFEKAADTISRSQD
ncbi:MAG: hypothetical protein R2764_02880 [Bacteroidales bacterium]